MDIEAVMQRIGGYVSNLGKLKGLMLELKPLTTSQAMERVEELISQAEGTWLTDLNILHNAIEEMQH